MLELAYGLCVSEYKIGFLTTLQVFVGFVAPALLTIGAMILGYLTMSLPEGTLTDFDHKTAEKFASSWIGRTSAKAWKAFSFISRRCLFLRPSNKEDDLDKGQRREALQKFVLTLSDQQLVVGIAILLACFVNWCQTSVYELNVVVSLAWFSSSTHLATLDVLRIYFQRNHVVRNWRMIGIVVLLQLLIAGLLLAEYYSDNSGSFSVTSFASVLVVFSLGYQNTHAILGTFTVSRNRPLTPSHIMVRLVLCIMGRTKQVSMKFVDSVMIDIWAKKMMCYEQRIARFLETKNEWIWRFFVILLVYYRSMLFTIAELLIILSWGISQMATWIYPRLQPESTHLDFGQIVPLVLLVLPLLTAVEIFHGKLAPRTTFMY